MEVNDLCHHYYHLTLVPVTAARKRQAAHQRGAHDCRRTIQRPRPQPKELRVVGSFRPLHLGGYKCMLRHTYTQTPTHTQTRHTGHARCSLEPVATHVSSLLSSSVRLSSHSACRHPSPHTLTPLQLPRFNSSSWAPRRRAIICTSQSYTAATARASGLTCHEWHTTEQPIRPTCMLTST